MFIEKICVASDGSDVAVRAAQIAVVLAQAGARRILAVSVAQPSSPGGADRALQAAGAHADTVARIAHAVGVACETWVTSAWPPGPEIVRAAQEQGCDLIVMGAHGSQEADTRYLGSVARHVLACSPVPVMVLRDPREATPPEFRDVPPGGADADE
ncbi:universal stress protein [Telluria mixta]|uniref:Universal stress protein n=1 Tax=Telluria mixta TaxID=34071 RepID=A0ABT2BTC7_9BURK|nr:universal stress protein [Telluria mixta]MCS0628232.1 universal stress protein [Telluria mixta]WEM93654.1 universal stress protein [Telluria mixta]